MNYFTSDLHIHHANILEFCNRKAKWNTVEEMDQGIIDIWNNTVKPEDTVYVLGDFSLSPRWSTEVIPKLNGKKILLIGNHDQCFAYKNHRVNRRAERMRIRYLTDGWSELHDKLEITLSNGLNVLLCHFPYKPTGPKDPNFDLRYLEYRLEDTGKHLLHGHSHVSYRKHGRMIDVGFDGDYKLWSEQEIIDLINDPREFIESPLAEYYKGRQRDRNKVESY